MCVSSRTVLNGSSKYSYECISEGFKDAFNLTNPTVGCYDLNSRDNSTVEACFCDTNYCNEGIKSTSSILKFISMVIRKTVAIIKTFTMSLDNATGVLVCNANDQKSGFETERCSIGQDFCMTVKISDKFGGKEAFKYSCITQDFKSMYNISNLVVGCQVLEWANETASVCLCNTDLCNKGLVNTTGMKSNICRKMYLMILNELGLHRFTGLQQRHLCEQL